MLTLSHNWWARANGGRKQQRCASSSVRAAICFMPPWEKSSARSDGHGPPFPALQRRPLGHEELQYRGCSSSQWVNPKAKSKKSAMLEEKKRRQKIHFSREDTVGLCNLFQCCFASVCASTFSQCSVQDRSAPHTQTDDLRTKANTLSN